MTSTTSPSSSARVGDSSSISRYIDSAMLDRSRMLSLCSTFRLIICRASFPGTTTMGNSFTPSSTPAWKRCWPSMITYLSSRSTATSGVMKPIRSIDALSAFR